MGTKVDSLVNEGTPREYGIGEMALIDQSTAKAPCKAAALAIMRVMADQLRKSNMRAREVV